MIAGQVPGSCRPCEWVLLLTKGRDRWQKRKGVFRNARVVCFLRQSATMQAQGEKLWGSQGRKDLILDNSGRCLLSYTRSKEGERCDQRYGSKSSTLIA